MTPDPELPCCPAEAPPVQDERSVKTELIQRVEAKSSPVKKLIYGLLAFGLIAGIAVAVMVKRGAGRTAATSASADVATETEGSAAEVVVTEAPAKDVATATAPTGDKPAECLGEIVDPTLRYYCETLHPFATKASADHDRIDRIEPVVKRLEEAEARSSGRSDAPLALWAIAGFGLFLTVINTLLFISMKRKKSAEPPPAG